MIQLDLFQQKPLIQNVRNYEGNTLIIATWNVNSIRARINQVLDWLKVNNPDVLCMQEIKVDNNHFPYEEFRSLGYEQIIHGQKTYNGVAVLSKIPIKSYSKGFSNDHLDKGARLIVAELSHFNLITVYIPNAKSINDVSFNYKIEWLNGLKKLINKIFLKNENLIVCGDFNVAPFENDVDNPNYYLYDSFIHEKVRTEYFGILRQGLVDDFHLRNKSGGNYTWWDYRGNAFEQNRGMRIDHILVSNNLKRFIKKTQIDKTARSYLKSSDHAPVMLEISIG